MFLIRSSQSVEKVGETLWAEVFGSKVEISIATPSSLEKPAVIATFISVGLHGSGQVTIEFFAFGAPEEVELFGRMSIKAKKEDALAKKLAMSIVSHGKFDDVVRRLESKDYAKIREIKGVGGIAIKKLYRFAKDSAPGSPSSREAFLGDV